VFQKFFNEEKVITFAAEKTNKHRVPTLTKDKALSLLIGSESTQSTISSTENECTCRDINPCNHRKEMKHLTPNLSKGLTTPEKELNIEITNNDADDEHPLSTNQNAIKRKAGKDAFFDILISEASHAKQKLLSMMTCPTEDCSLSRVPMPAGFVSNDSISSRSSMKVKLYNKASPVRNKTIITKREDNS
jgi:hypothetical protein